MQAAQASYSGKAQHHKQGRCATISAPTLDRLRLHIIVSYSIVWWIQAAQASYSGEAQHQKKVRCATIGIPTLDRLRLHSAGYSSEEGLDSEDEIDEDKWIHNESCDTSTLKAWDYATKFRERVNARHWEGAKITIGISTSCVGAGPAASMALTDIFPKGKIRLLSVTEPDAGRLKAATVLSTSGKNEGPEVAFTNLDDAGKEKVHCEVHHTHYNVPPGGDEQIFIGSFNAAAQASYSGKAQHHKQGRCATISTHTLERLRLHSIVSYRIV